MNMQEDLVSRKIGVLLSGCGVYDGAEIQETVLAMLAIEEMGYQTLCIAINENQYHVINHYTGEVMENEQRNMLVEASRIARGNITEINNVQLDDMYALVIPGGFGSAKNFTSWAFDGEKGNIHPLVKKLIADVHSAKKAIVALCVSPVVVAKTFEKSETKPKLTIGTTKEKSPYDIEEFSKKMEQIETITTLKNIREIEIDHINKIITAPCYMMEASLIEVRNNIKQAIEAIQKLNI